MKNILVTGGSRGFGRAIALTLEKEIPCSKITTIARGPITELKECGNVRHVEISVMDAATKDSFDLCYNLASFDVLINCAGISTSGYLAKEKPENIESVIQTNLIAPILLSQRYVASRLKEKKGGQIINIGSIVSEKAHAGLSIYTASKAGIAGFTQALAKELGGKGFRVNAVLPGYSNTQMLKDVSTDYLNEIIRQTPTGHLSTRHDIANTVLFLINSDNVNGVLLPIDGGYCI